MFSEFLELFASTEGGKDVSLLHKGKKAGKHLGRFALWIRLYSAMTDSELKMEQDEVRRNDYMDAKEKRERLRAIDEARVLKHLKAS